MIAVLKTRLEDDNKSIILFDDEEAFAKYIGDKYFRAYLKDVRETLCLQIINEEYACLIPNKDTSKFNWALATEEDDQLKYPQGTVVYECIGLTLVTPIYVSVIL